MVLLFITCCVKAKTGSERQGFEPWEGVTLNDFQDRRLKPLSHLSKCAVDYAIKKAYRVEIT